MRLKNIIATLIAALPPATTAIYRPQLLKAHPLEASVALLAYILFCGIIAFWAKVYRRLELQWTERTANYLDQSITQKLSGTRRRYLKYVQVFHRDVNLGGLAIRAPFLFPLAEVFVDISLVSTSPHRMSSDLLGGPSADNTTIREREPPETRNSIWHFFIAGKASHLAIVGAPGSGKSTLLAHIALTLTSRQERKRIRKFPRKTIPVVLFLREHSDLIYHNRSISLADVILASLSALPSRPPSSWFENYLRSGNCVIMLDGLDEVALQVQRRQIVDWVQLQMINYPRCSFIITSRPFGYEEHPINGVSVLQVRALSRQQIRQFVEKWSLIVSPRSADRERDSAITRNIAKSKSDELLTRLADPSLHDLAANPLLLTMIAHLHYYGGSLPANRAQVYQEICRVFLGRRQESKNLLSELLTINQKELVLCHLALHMMINHKHDLPQDRAQAVIRQTLNSVKPDLPPQDFLEHIQNSSGLIIEREKGVIAFVHETIQEYLTSVQIREEQALYLLTTNVTDIWWRDTILLYCAQADANPIVSACLNDNSPTAIALAADCAESARELSAEYRRNVERALSYKGISSDQNVRRVVGTALLTRKLRRIALLDTGSYVVAAPISVKEYELFGELYRRPAPKSAANPSASAAALSRESAEQPVRGISPHDAWLFSRWVTQQVADGWSYRLPTPEEGADLVINSVLNDDYLSFYTARRITDDGPSGKAIKIAVRPARLTRPMTVLDGTLASFDWTTISSTLDGLTPQTRSDLRSHWSVRWDNGPPAFQPWPMHGSNADLLKLVTLLVVLEEQDAYWLLVSLQRRLRRPIYGLLELTELLENRELLSERHRQLLITDSGARRIAPDTARKLRLTFACFALQLRMDYFRYSHEFAPVMMHLTSGEWQFNFPIMSYFPNEPELFFTSISLDWKLGLGPDTLRAEVDKAKVSIEDNSLWGEFGVLYSSRRDWLLELVNAMRKSIAMPSKGNLDEAELAHRRADARMASLAALNLVHYLSGLVPGKRTGDSSTTAPGPMLRDLEKIFKNVLSSLTYLEWQHDGLIVTTDTIVLVRD